MFFDDHPEFETTSQTANSIDRLNLRHLAIIEQHRDILKGARVLDIASHDGRWSFAALDAGAAHVTGVEGRADLVANANQTFASKGIDESRFKFVVGDAHDLLTPELGSFDVVMCLGFLYHTLRYPELFAGIRGTGAKHMMIDSKVITAKAPIVKVIGNPTHIESMAVEDRFTYRGKSLVGVPSAEALRTMLRLFGYKVIGGANWQELLRDHPGVPSLGVYKTGKRVTMLAIDASDADSD